MCPWESNFQFGEEIGVNANQETFTLSKERFKWLKNILQWNGKIIFFLHLLPTIPLEKYFCPSKSLKQTPDFVHALFLTEKIIRISKNVQKCSKRRKISVISDRVHNLYYMQIKTHDAIRTALPASSAVVVSPNSE